MGDDSRTDMIIRMKMKLCEDEDEKVCVDIKMVVN